MDRFYVWSIPAGWIVLSERETELRRILSLRTDSIPVWRGYATDARTALEAAS
jgi:hypothetical protein